MRINLVEYIGKGGLPGLLDPVYTGMEVESWGQSYRVRSLRMVGKGVSGKSVSGKGGPELWADIVFMENGSLEQREVPAHSIGFEIDFDLPAKYTGTTL